MKLCLYINKETKLSLLYTVILDVPDRFKVTIDYVRQWRILGLLWGIAAGSTMVGRAVKMYT